MPRRAAGAEVWHGTTVTGLVADGRRVGGGVAKDAAGRQLRARARVTIGADGIRSAVASAVAAPYERRAAGGGAVMYRYYEDFPAEGYEWAYGAGAAAGLIPTNDGLTCVFVATTPAGLGALRRRERSQAAFDRAVRHGCARPRGAGCARRAGSAGCTGGRACRDTCAASLGPRLGAGR